MVEVFRTNIRRRSQGKMLLSLLSEAFPSFKINFDLSDRDKILRAEGECVEPEKIILFMEESGFECGVVE